MSEPYPKKVVELVIGLDENFNFLNYFDPANPKPLTMDLSERCMLVFTMSDQLLKAGWKFQRRPIEVARDFGVNFSSYAWNQHYYKDKLAPFTSFKIVYECARMGTYTYSLMMEDSRGQRIDLDPDVENGAGHGP
jgi:hypothetical protein